MQAKIENIPAKIWKYPSYFLKYSSWNLEIFQLKVGNLPAKIGNIPAKIGNLPAKIGNLLIKIGNLGAKIENFPSNVEFSVKIRLVAAQLPASWLQLPTSCTPAPPHLPGSCPPAARQLSNSCPPAARQLPANCPPSARCQAGWPAGRLDAWPASRPGLVLKRLRKESCNEKCRNIATENDCDWKSELFDQKSRILQLLKRGYYNWKTNSNQKPLHLQQWKNLAIESASWTFSNWRAASQVAAQPHGWPCRPARSRRSAPPTAHNRAKRPAHRPVNT